MLLCTTIMFIPDHIYMCCCYYYELWLAFELSVFWGAKHASIAAAHSWIQHPSTLFIYYHQLQPCTLSILYIIHLYNYNQHNGIHTTHAYTPIALQYTLVRCQWNLCSHEDLGFNTFQSEVEDLFPIKLVMILRKQGTGIQQLVLRDTHHFVGRFELKSVQAGEKPHL